MANHGLTRVECRGDKVVVVAGPVPQHIEEQTVAQAAHETPMTRLHLQKQANLPPRFIAPPKAEEPQAEPAKPVEETK